MAAHRLYQGIMRPLISIMVFISLILFSGPIPAMDVQALESETKHTLHDLKSDPTNGADATETANTAILEYGWNSFFGSSFSDGGDNLVTDLSGNIFLVGGSMSSWNGPNGELPLHPLQGYGDIVVVKLSRNGEYQWHTFWGAGAGSSMMDRSLGAAADKNGNLYLTATSGLSWNGPMGEPPLHGYAGGASDVVIIKLSGSGNYLWHTFYGSSDLDYDGQLAIDSGGNIFITGQAYGTWNGPNGETPLHGFSSFRDIVVLKLNSAGQYLWHTFYGSSGEDQGTGIVVDLVGNIVIAGWSGSTWYGPNGELPRQAPSQNGSYLAVIKLTTSGGYLWHTFYGSNSYGASIVVDTSNDIVVTGYDHRTWNGPSGEKPLHPFTMIYYDSYGYYENIEVVKLSSSGQYLWHTFYFGWPAYETSMVSLDLDGNIYLTGSSQLSWKGPDGQNPLHAFSGGISDIALIKLSANGSYLWHSFYGSTVSDATINEIGTSLHVDQYGNIVMTGSSASWNGPTGQTPLHAYAGGGDIFVLKLKNKINTQPAPVILVHGFQGANSEGGYHCSQGIGRYPSETDSTLNSADGSPDLADWLVGEGYDVWIAHLESTPQDTPSLYSNAQCLSDQINTVYQQNSQPITIVAHSMGGLVSRAALYYVHGNVEVASLYTLGSPHAGLPFGALQLIWAKAKEQQAVYEMEEDYMSVFNGVNKNIRDINYFFLGGDGGRGIFDNALRSFGQGPNDGLVGQYSAVGWIYPDQITAPLDWTSNSSPGTFFTHETHPNFSPKEKAYYAAPPNQTSESFKCLSRLMKNPQDTQACQSAESQAPQMQPTLTAELPSNQSSFTEIKTGHLDAGQATSLPFVMDTTGPSIFYLNWSGGNAPTFTLRRPDAQVVDPVYAALHPVEVTYETSAGSPESAPATAFTFVSGQVGIWQANITATDAIDYKVFGMVDSTRLFTVQTDSDVYQIGAIATITALLDSNGASLSGATVTARISRPDNTVDTVALVNQGNGTYAGSYIIPSVAGHLTMNVSATGNDGGIPFSRQKNILVAIAPNDLQPTGNFSDQPQDDNTNGFYDHLAFTAGVHLTAAGEYAVSAELYAGDHLVTQSGDFFSLSTGTQTITLEFDGDEISKSKMDGPYTVKNVHFTPIDIGITAAHIEDAWTTSAYPYWQFADGATGADTTGVFRPSNGLLYLKNKNESGFADAALNYGLPGDYPVVGDWDGNGTVTIGVYRDGYFYLKNANTLGFAEVVFPFGQLGDQPIAGDWDGDGVDTIGVYRPSTGQFLLRNSNSEGITEASFYLGNVGDVGIAGDWDGDGIDTTGVFRPSNGLLYLKNRNESGFADAALNYGLPGDRPVTGDWDNDGIDTIGVYRNGQFMLRNENTIGFAEIIFGLGNPGDMPIAGNWDGLP